MRGGEGVAVNSGTAALHCAMRAIGVGAGDEVIVPAITFAASANAAVYEGATPVFADVERDTLLLDPASVMIKITPKTKAVVAVDYAGQPADYDALRDLARDRGIALIADACHAPGATYKGRKTGTLADITCFSFHPVKHMTTCEGGMAVTDGVETAAHMRRFRNHGIDSDHRSREARGAHAYDMAELGYNYRLPDVQCALGLAQLSRLDGWVARRQQVAAWYDAGACRHGRGGAAQDPQGPYPRPSFVCGGAGTSISTATRSSPACGPRASAPMCITRRSICIPTIAGAGYAPGLAPVAEAMSKRILTLPMFPAMRYSDVARVAGALRRATA